MNFTHFRPISAVRKTSPTERAEREKKAASSFSSPFRFYLDKSNATIELRSGSSQRSCRSSREKLVIVRIRIGDFWPRLQRSRTRGTRTHSRFIAGDEGASCGDPDCDGRPGEGRFQERDGAESERKPRSASRAAQEDTKSSKCRIKTPIFVIF